jgi:hypothetical protein
MSAPGDYDNGEISGMIGRGNRSTRRKPAPMPLCPPQTLYSAGTRTRAAAVGSQRLTAELRHGQAHEVSSRLLTAAARVRVQVKSCGICGGQSGTWKGFLLVLRFPLPIIPPPTAPHSSSSIIWGWYNRPISGQRTKWTQSHPTQRN